MQSRVCIYEYMLSMCMYAYEYVRNCNEKNKDLQHKYIFSGGSAGDIFLCYIFSQPSTLYVVVYAVYSRVDMLLCRAQV